jgi:hypothetical protein
MMQPDKVKIRAIIPSTEHPDVHIIDRSGLYPEEETADLTASPERVLHEIGEKVINSAALSVDMTQRANYQVPYTDTYINIANVRAKPIDPNTVTLTEGYGWKKV